MYTPQTIVIIGAGEMGRGIVSAMAAGHDKVLVCDQGDRVKNLVADLQQDYPYYDVEATDCSYDATWEADVIILDLPGTDLLDTAGRIKAVANQKVVVSVGMVAALQGLLPYSKVVQAFTNLQPSSFYLPKNERNQIDCLVSGNDKEAINTVEGIISTIGFKPVFVNHETFITAA